MFTYLLQILRRFQSRPVVSILIAALVILIVAVLLGSFIRWLRRRRQERPDNWVGLITGSLGDVLKVLIGLAILVALGLYLRFQSQEFARVRGGVSERNYEAVKAIWGRPHLQGELDVRFVQYTKKYFDKDGLEFDVEKLRATSQPIAYRAVDIEETISANPILEADHDIKLVMNYRRKGNASYPGFEVDCRFSYLIENASGKDVTAVFSFPLPRGQGLVDKLHVVLDDKDVGEWVTIVDEAARWKHDLAKGQKRRLTISYHSRGLDYIRLEPGAGRKLQKYLVRMSCQGVDEADINYPIGCMTPTRKEPQPGGTLLEWDLQQAVSRLGMGVILPKEKQEGYYVAQILAAAPWALVLLLAMVLVSHLATGRALQYAPLLLLAGALDLYYLLMAHIGDYWPGLVGGMIVSAIVLTALTALLWFKRADRFAAGSTVAFFAAFCVVYPLIVISDYEGLLMTILYVALLAYVTVLLIAARRPSAAATAERPAKARPA